MTRQSYIANCTIYVRTNQDEPVVAVDDGVVTVHLDGYVLIPKEYFVAKNNPIPSKVKPLDITWIKPA